MTFDFTASPAPEEWSRFTGVVRLHAPRMPDTGSSRGAVVASGASTSATMAGAGVSGAGASLPTGAGAVVGVAGGLATGDGGGVVDSLVDEAIGAIADHALGGEAGWLVGGLLMLMRGTEASLSLTDAMSSYLNEMSGYLSTLVRVTMGAMADRYPYATMPNPVVPPYIERTGDLYSSFARSAFTAGHFRVNDVIREIDSVRPPTGDYPSKRCFTYIGMQTNMTGGRGTEGLLHVMRVRAERYIVRSLLQVNMAAQAETLRRWAMTG